MATIPGRTVTYGRKSYSIDICLDSWGVYAEVYTDDDGASGYGDHTLSGRWYGTREECEAIDPRKVDLYPITADNSPDPFDLACERRHDYAEEV